MRRELARDLARVVESCSSELDDATREMGCESGDDAQGLWRLHVAGVLGAMVNYLLVPAWKEHPDVWAPGPELTPGHARFVLSPAAVARGAEALERVKSLIAALSATGDGPQALKGLAEVQRRVAELEEYLATLRDNATDPSRPVS